jgi:xylono-1,5-lactonase
VTPEIRLVWNSGCLLGEGPVWLADEQALRFVDIKRGMLHRFAPATQACEKLDVGGKPSFIVPEAPGKFLVGSEHGIHRLEGGRLSRSIATIEQPAHNRTNDGTVDVHGRLWFGTMDDEERAKTGALYCLDEHGLHRMDVEAIVTNGPAISPDGTTLYHVDSANRRIWRYKVEDGPALGEAELFLQLGAADGYPDGITLDAEDCLWVALWDGWTVRRYGADGTLIVTMNFPCSRVTKLAFGGADLRTAYVTSARIGLDSASLAEQPLAGAVFAFDTKVPGNLMPSVGVHSPA